MAKTPENVSAASAPPAVVTGVMIGAILIVAALAGFLLSRPTAPISVGLEALGGLVLLSLSLAGLIIVSQALGLATPHQALGLPSGSVRALLAFSLVIAFVAIASWSLGDHAHAGAVVYTKAVKPDDSPAAIAAVMTDEQKLFPAPRYTVVFNRASNAVEAAEVIDSEGRQQVFDLQKQIMTIIATALVTVIGFYFGSKSSSDAAATIANVQKQLVAKNNGADAVEEAPPDKPPSLDDLQKVSAQIRAMATAAQTNRDALGAGPLKDLQDAVAGQTDTKLQSQLSDAQAALDELDKGVSATDTDADRSEEEVSKLDATADADTLTTSQGKLAGWLDDATKTDAAFTASLTRFTTARDAILAATAKG
jgi:hypothetical protein